MIKLLLPLLFLLYLGFTACTDANGTPTDESTTILDSTLYEIVTLERKSPDCAGTEEDPCATASASYVQITKSTSLEIKQKVNQLIIDSLRGSSATIEASLESFIQEFQTSNAEMVQEMEDAPIVPWESQLSQEVVYNTPRIFTVATNFYAYMGGAHGMHGTSYTNFNMINGSVISLNDLFSGNYKSQLESLGATYFRQQHDLAENTTWEDSGFWFEENQFYLPDNFAIIEEGLKFVYSIYEIAPYAAGEQEVVIPYSELEGMMKADSPLK